MGNSKSNCLTRNLEEGRKNIEMNEKIQKQKDIERELDDYCVNIRIASKKEETKVVYNNIQNSEVKIILIKLGYDVAMDEYYTAYTVVKWHNPGSNITYRKNNLNAKNALLFSRDGLISKIDKIIDEKGVYRWDLNILDFKTHNKYINSVTEKYKTVWYNITYEGIDANVRAIVIRRKEMGLNDITNENTQPPAYVDID